jgi:hypothetical protein
MSVGWAILHGGLWLTLHAVWGLVLVLAALGTLIQAIGFLNYHQDFSTMLMAVGFALAMSVHLALLYRSGIATPMQEL